MKIGITGTDGAGVVDGRIGRPIGYSRRVALVAIVLLALACAAATAASSTPLQLKPSSKFDGWQIAVKAVLIGAIGVAALGGGLFAWREWQRTKGVTVGTNDPASVEWARRVSPRTTLYVVRWHGKRYLLAEGVSQTSVIDSHAIEESQT